MATNKGFIKDWMGNYILPITRGELVVDKDGNIALNSEQFLATNGHPGLVTAAERAILNGSSGGSITDVYNKLGYINNGLSFNGTSVNFYNDAGGTPIKIVSEDPGKIKMVVGDNNTISLGLTELSTTETSVSNILKSITVDKYGRVTGVTGSPLTNAELPSTIDNKTITNSTLTGCVTGQDTIGDDIRAIVNKNYVDIKFAEVSGIATGALKFGGTLNSEDIAIAALNIVSNFNSYYKVTTAFQLDVEYLYETNGIIGDVVQLKIGDTLIIYPQNNVGKFIYVPSADDLTKITIQGSEGEPALQNKTGNVGIEFSGVFDVVNKSGYSDYALITLPQATASTDGYLSKTDYVKFTSYAENLAVSYDSAFTTHPAIYDIGTLTIGGVENKIYGKNNISSLTLNNGSTDQYNPILKFTETGNVDVNITFNGINGILVKNNNGNVELAANNVVVTQQVPQNSNQRTAQYLSITEGYKFGVVLGSSDSNGDLANDGLTDYSQFLTLVKRVLATAVYETIDYSLNGEDNENEYRYGNDKLKAAISVTI